MLTTSLFFYSLQILVFERNCKPIEISKQSHPLFLMYLIVFICWSKYRGYSRTNNESSSWKIDSQQTTSMGITHHLYRADKKSNLQILDARICTLCSWNWKVSSKWWNNTILVLIWFIFMYIFLFQVIWIGSEILYGAEIFKPAIGWGITRLMY